MSTINSNSLNLMQRLDKKPRLLFLGLAGLVLMWIAIYESLIPLSNWLVSLLPINKDSHLGTSLQFFLYDTPKVLLLLTAVVFVMGIVNTYFTAERTRAILLRRGYVFSHVLAALLGSVTPFCSCSSVPLFIGFVKSGIPLGVTFAFLIASPLIGPIAIAMLYSMFGWEITLLFITVGLIMAIVSGLFLGSLKLDKYLEDWVKAMPNINAEGDNQTMRFSERIRVAVGEVKSVVGKVWFFVVIGIGVGAGIHGFVPESLLLSLLGKDAAWWAVPLAVVIGVPMYANPAGIMPIIQALTAKGVALGTALAFMMSVITLSLPEMIMLRKVLKLRLITVFIATITINILVVGYIFNAIL